MSAFPTLLVVSVAVAAISIAILMLDDLFAELDRRRTYYESLADSAAPASRHF